MARFPFADPSALHYWIIGAAGGIGAALCRELHANGATLTVSSRKEDDLNALRDDLGGERVTVYPLDISDAQAVTRAANAIAADSVVLLAAAYRKPVMTSTLTTEEISRIVNVNVSGAFYLTSAVIPLLEKKGGGQITLCASVAGYSGLPCGQPYCATKAAILNQAESLRAEHDGTGVDVKVICPGFVKTQLTDKNDFPMPMIISAEAAGKALMKGLTRKGFEIHFPKHFTFILKLLRILPYCLYLPIAKRIKP